ncbi:MAG: PKD domain-containing protein [Ginsengibacter sp.]
MRRYLPKNILLLILFFLFVVISADAQVNASFSTDIPGGCSPLTVHFTNNSSASSTTVYQWDFGNGNTSTLRDAAAVFLTQKSYTVKLTVTDGNQTSSNTQTITVYQKPVVDFSTSLQKVCTPEPAPFTAKATADNGTVTDYLWDFGDGFTQHSYDPQVSHVFLTAQDAQVRLTVTDNHGCTNSKTISNIIKVFNGVTADFDADKTFICFQPDPVQMINKSEGEGPLKYSWDFGDGNLATAKDPSHVFSKKGNYTVSLAIENPNGCKSSLVKTSYLNVGNFKSQMNVPDFTCQNSTVSWQNTSIPAPTSYSWLVDGVYYPSYYQGYFAYQVGGHTIQLINQFGTCIDTTSKNITVNALPQPTGFVTQIQKYCFPPVTVNFQDTTAGAVKSEWNFYMYAPSTIQATGKTASFAFTSANYWSTTLFVTDSNGCTNSVTQTVNITQPFVSIYPIDNNNITCESLTKQFAMTSNKDLASFTWNFGDGTTSTKAEPEHTFTTGSYNVTLTYTTKDGCSGVSNSYPITVYPQPNADFTTTNGTIICGDSPVSFQKKPTNSIFDYWYVNQQYIGFNGLYNFPDTGKYTITLITANPGCADTMTKTNYITVLPTFPQINQLLNTCEGDRGTVTFGQASRYAQKWVWDFGDGTNAIYTTDKQLITHHYAASGLYNATLTTSSGQCANKTSIGVLVILKKQPVLSAGNSNLCKDDALNFTISNLDQPNYGYYYNPYLEFANYNDGTTVSIYNYMTAPVYTGSINNLLAGKDSIRMIFSGALNCIDTTNFIPIKVRGAVAGFQVITDNVCFHLPVTFKDTSSTQNTTITSRTWNFGDGQTLTTTTGGIVSHIYSDPGSYYVSLSITDATGCTSTTYSYSQTVYANGPKAAFTANGTEFHLNTSVQFYNNTNYFNSYNTQYQWDFGDGNTSADYNPVNTFTKPGNYTIRLIAKNPDTGCGDTAYQKITVKNFNANFSFTSSFIDNINCSSLLVQFVNTSYDYTHIKWDFGDGFTSDNVNTPSHVYSQPGKYIVKLFVTGNNGLSKTYIDSVIVYDNKINITASMSHTCTSQSVTLSGLSQDASFYLWDFGDGTVVQASDSFSVHYYKTPGNYTPALIAKNPDGCAASITLSTKISIDSLNVTLKDIPKICTPKEVQFDPVVFNISSNVESLVYHWDFGTGVASDTSNIQAPLFKYQKPGNYQVTVNVQSKDGCSKQATAMVVALQGLGAQIKGPSEICEQATVQFMGTTLLPGQPAWKWIFDDGTIVTQQNPPAKVYNKPGNFVIKLIADNGGCVDTVTQTLQVHSKPLVTLSAKDAILCEGSSLSIAAGGGNSYSWSPATGLDATNQATVVASPLNNTNYGVTVINSFGCVNNASVAINVIHPFALQLAKEVEICSGQSTTLQASGGISFQWINNTNGLNNVMIANPVASPSLSTIYTLVASGENQCFSDTAEVTVTVKPTPVVHLGNDTTICEGRSLILNAFTANAIYTWQDATSASSFTVKNQGQYFVVVNLNNCKASDTINIHEIAIPYFSLGKDSAICLGEEYILKPALNTEATFLWEDGSTASSFVVTKEGMYTLTAKNECGSHSDSITITKGLCNILMPTAFTPNKDGLNEVFRVKFPFAVTNFHFLITNRWGQTVFETNNIHDGWDGSFKGAPPLQGIYVWVISFTDITSHKSQQVKGIVTLLK